VQIFSTPSSQNTAQNRHTGPELRSDCYIVFCTNRFQSESNRKGRAGSLASKPIETIEANGLEGARGRTAPSLLLLAHTLVYKERYAYSFPP
jgi:hypothetical protein